MEQRLDQTEFTYITIRTILCVVESPYLSLIIDKVNKCTDVY